jgi:hypothetical protein
LFDRCKLVTMPLSKKAWEETLAQAQDDVIFQAIQFRNKEFELEARQSPEPNLHYGTLFRSLDVLEFVYDARPMPKSPKLSITTFSFEADTPHVEGGEK